MPPAELSLSAPSTPPLQPSPRLVTPDQDVHPPPLLFTKQAFRLPPTSTASSIGSDSDVGIGPYDDLAPSSVSEPRHPVSLLTALLSSPEHAPRAKAPHSVASSTASPKLAPAAPLDAGVSPSGPARSGPVASILRRESLSASSDGEAMVEQLAGAEEPVLPPGDHATRPRASTLKFAVAPRMSTGAEHAVRPADLPVADELPETPIDEEDDSFDDGEAGDDGEEIDDGEDVADDAGDNDDGEDVNGTGAHGNVAIDDLSPGSVDSDGYEEDSEGGFSSNDDAQPRPTRARSYSFARPTHYRRRRRHLSPSVSPPPAPAVLPPPSRRGRGHVRVDATASDHAACSRHRSPPPVAKPRSGRLSEAGPRPGRAGSPMPGPIEPSDDEESAAEVAPPGRAAAPGWRSDDAVFYGPRARVRSRAPPVFDDSDDDAAPPRSGVRDFFRRASEHVSALRRPSVVAGAMPAASFAPRPVATASPVAPAIDDTPATARSVSHGDAFERSADAIAQRLEQTLSTHTPSPHGSRPASGAGAPVGTANLASSLGAQAVSSTMSPSASAPVPVGGIMRAPDPVDVNAGADLGRAKSTGRIAFAEQARRGRGGPGVRRKSTVAAVSADEGARRGPNALRGW